MGKLDQKIQPKSALRRSSRRAVVEKERVSEIRHHLLLGPTVARQEKKRRAQKQSLDQDLKEDNLFSTTTLVKDGSDTASSTRKSPPCTRAASRQRSEKEGPASPKPPLRKMSAISPEWERGSKRKPDSQISISQASPKAAASVHASRIPSSHPIAEVVIRPDEATSDPVVVTPNRHRVHKKRQRTSHSSTSPPREEVHIRRDEQEARRTISSQHRHQQEQDIHVRMPTATSSRPIERANEYEGARQSSSFHPLGEECLTASRDLQNRIFLAEISDPGLSAAELTIRERIAAMHRTAFAAANQELVLLERRNLALEALMHASDVTTVYAALSLVRGLHEGASLSPTAARIVLEAQVSSKVLLSETLMQRLTTPTIFGGLAYPDAEAVIFVRQIVRSFGDVMDNLIASPEHLVAIGLPGLDAIHIAPYMRLLGQEIKTKACALWERLLAGMRRRGPRSATDYLHILS